MDGKYDNVIKYYTRNLKLLKENNIIMFCDIDDIDSYSMEPDKISMFFPFF